MSPRSGWLASWLVILVCATGGGRVFGQVCPEEQTRARAVAIRVNEEWPQRPGGDEVARYLQGLGERLGRATAAGTGIDWRFITLRDRAAFAFAIGFGYIYVADGILTFARTESEVAAVLAHEIGHQLAGHFCRRPAPRDGLLRRGETVQAPIGSLNQVIDLGKELEADRLALGILGAAGFDPRAMYTVAERLPESAAYGHGQGDNRRLAALEQRLGRGPTPRFTEPPADAFRRAQATVAAGR